MNVLCTKTYFYKFLNMNDIIIINLLEVKKKLLLNTF